MLTRKKLERMYRASISGDKTALIKLIGYQRAGKCLRYYPDGRFGPEDEGFIAISLVPWRGSDGEFGMTLHAGRRRKQFHLRREQAVDLVCQIRRSQLTAVPIIPPIGARVGADGQYIELLMHREDCMFRMTADEAAGLAEILAGELYESACSDDDRKSLAVAFGDE